jgi:hypothetical protein
MVTMTADLHQIEELYARIDARARVRALRARDARRAHVARARVKYVGRMRARQLNR